MKKILDKLRNDRYWFNVLVCIAVILVLVSVPILLVQFKKFNISQVSTVYQTRISKSASDKVKLKENDVFVNNNGEYYSSDFYVASLLESVNIDFYNSINFYTTNYDIDYTKTIKVSLVVESVDGVILEENVSGEGVNYYFQESGKATNASSVFNLDESIEFEYSQFTTRLSEIQRVCEGITCYGNLKVVYSTSCVGTVINEEFSYYDTMTSYIPIETTGTMDMSYNFSPTSEINKTETTFYNDANYFWIVFGFLLGLIALGIFVLIAMVVSQKCRENADQKHIDKILNQYNDILVKVDGPIENKNPILKVCSFDDLVKVETELSLPIVWHAGDKVYSFYVHGENVTYCYEFLLDSKEILEPVSDSNDKMFDKGKTSKNKGNKK